MKLNLGLDFNFNELIVSLIILLMAALFGIWKNFNSSESFNINLNDEIEQMAE
jgi:hypothetical protein